MRWSRFFIPTMKEVPADAVASSHVLLIRAGLARQLAAGAYVYLPLGYRVIRKIEQIIREEMDRAGAIELFMPALAPAELWKQTGRYTAFGAPLIKLPSVPWRQDLVLSPTHEETITEIARTFLKSYKQLPINLYQIQTKFRDEERAKSGVLRTREFQMKDAYSFDADKAGLDRSYQKMYEAYCRIFDRAGLSYLIVEAESGPIGGDVSHEFMVLTDAGEDIVAMTEDGSYAANIERAEVAPLPDPGCETLDALREVHTPDMKSIEQVSAFLGCRPQDMIKTIVYLADGEPLVALVRGDHEVNESKLARAAGATSVEPADPETIRRVTGAEVGFAGPVGLDVRMIADQAVAVMHNAVTGANKTDYHLTGVNAGRDYEIRQVADIRVAAPGDRAPNGKPLVFKKCIEIGHVFKLGTKYSEAMGARFLDADGVSRPMIMGCYGIGVNRIMAAAMELHHDEAGLIWPMSIAPFHVLIVALDVRDEQVMQTAERLHDELEACGLDVLLDDRDVRAGPKFKDADLIGIPLRVTVGKRSLTQGFVEIKPRASDEVSKVPPEQACQQVRQRVEAALAELSGRPAPRPA